MLAHKAGLAPPLFIEVPVQSNGNERSRISVLGEWILSLSAIYLLDFGNVRTVCHFTMYVIICNSSYCLIINEKLFKWSISRQV